MRRDELLYTADQMSRADTNAQKLGIPGGVLMERAGAAIAGVIAGRFAPQNVLVVCGGGNNGGDGFVIARELNRTGFSVSVVATRNEYSGDAKTNLDVLVNLGFHIHPPEDLEGLISVSSLVVDALLGTGFSGELRGLEAGVISALNSAKLPVVAVDVPSGVNGSTGEVAGVAVRATLTVCAHAAKVGCVISPGRGYSGEVAVVGIGLPEKAEVEPSVRLTVPGSLNAPKLSGEVHKYSAGALMVVAGSRAMTGAGVMVVEGAQRAGCGMVFLAAPKSTAPALDLRLTETLVYGMEEDEDGHVSPDALDTILAAGERASAYVVGPGIGVGEEQGKLVEGLLREVEVPLLLDADAITNLSNVAGTDAISRRSAPTVITPHAGELGRLLGTGAGEVSAHRLASVRRAADESGSIVLVKGADTLVAAGGEVFVNTTGSVALATGGTGDILSGVIGALLCRGMEPCEAARCGAWVHGRAAELWLEATGFLEESLVATDLIPYIPKAMAELSEL